MAVQVKRMVLKYRECAAVLDEGIRLYYNVDYSLNYDE